jgi:hypothetical protein
MMSEEIPVISCQSKRWTRCHYCNRKYDFTEALHEDGIYVICPHCGHYKKDLSRNFK